MISIVFPAYNEEKNVSELHRRLIAVLTKLGEPFEIIGVDNASTDGTFGELRKLSPIRIISLAYNIGQTAGLDAGIHEAKGDIVVVMDADLQNDPVDIPMLVAKIREGYDVVSGWRVERKDSLGRRILSRLANWLTAKMTGLTLHDSACALKAYRREVIQSVHLYGEMHVFLPAYLYMKGAKVSEVPVRHHARTAGVSKHYFMKAVKDIFDLITIKFLAGLSGRPLIFFGGVGFVSGTVGIVAAVFSLYLKLAGLRNFGQTPLPLIASFFVLSGIIFFMMGFLAELMLRVYFETNRKTPYTIKERVEIG
ncbi:MAG: family 2 glycosyl transferase [Parcubacteria group bacterium Greene0416_79]|nr:MAG: family 2 glycosyl transferase [Parcubacteria group bacterium Greene0416_79]